MPTAPRSRKYAGEGLEEEGWNYAEGGEEGALDEGAGEADSSSDDDDDEDVEKGQRQGQQRTAEHGGGEVDASVQVRSFAGNRCDLLWQGLLPKRVFTGFKFQESATAAAARKLLKAKGVGHYWDMVEHADSAIAAAAPLSLF